MIVKKYFGSLIKNEIKCKYMAKLISVKINTEIKPLYDIEVKDNNNFVANDIVVHNSEQYLSRESLCVLGSINCGKFSTKQEIFIGQLEKIGKSINRFLDNVNECELVHQTYATPHQAMAIRKLRRTGAGLTNIAAWLFRKGLVYGTSEANNAVEDFMKWYNYWLYISTEELGKEKGNFGLFDKEKWKSAPFVSNMIKESEKLNREFKVPILNGNYARNVTLSSIAPTGSISLLFRDFVLSYGIEPAFFLYYWKRTRMSGKYEYYFCVPRVVREMFYEIGIDLPMTSDCIKDDWDGKYGKEIAKKIDEHRQKFKFKESPEIKPMDKLNLMSQVMKWVDSSISVTYMLPIGSTWEDVYTFIIEAHKKEVKSIAAFPDKKMYGIITNTPFKELAFKLKDEGVNIHHQNFSDDELKELNISREHITQKTTEYPKRLQTIDADIHVVTVKGNKYCVVVGIQNGQPYEIFGGHLNGLGIKSNFKKGKIIKVKRGQYSLEFDDILIEDFSKQFTPTEQILFRMVSLQMRHGIPLKFVVEQLQKATEDMTTMASAAARVIKKYIPDGESVTGQQCPTCKSTTLYYNNGCVSCGCGWSRCA